MSQLRKTCQNLRLHIIDKKVWPVMNPNSMFVAVAILMPAVRTSTG